MTKKIAMLFMALGLFSCTSKAQKEGNKNSYSVNKTEAQWKKQLTEAEYHVLREAGTECPFSSPLNNNKEVGTYVCKGCAKPLYLSKHKFDSGTGWPSFDRGIDENLAYDVDYKIGYARSELKCANCGSHLGHVFNDGPKETTGNRHCINGLSLSFIPEE